MPNAFIESAKHIKVTYFNKLQDILLNYGLFPTFVMVYNAPTSVFLQKHSL